MNRLIAASLLLACVSCTTQQSPGDYDPLATSVAQIQTVATTLADDSRDREIPLLIYLPAADGPHPVVMFSHGLGGTVRAATYLGNHWAARGYLTVFMQHRGSDASVMQGVPPQQRLPALRRAANRESFLDRVNDVSAIIDTLETWNADPAHRFYGQLRLDAIGMSGHSYGARTTQAVTGQFMGANNPDTQDHRIKASVILSPSSPPGQNLEPVFGDVTIPWLLMTGTEDIAAVGAQYIQNRLVVYPALPTGGKYELVLANGAHHAFTDRAAANLSPRIPHHHPAIMALSTAFWDTYLLGNDAAMQWLQGEGARSVLQTEDRWQYK